MPLFKTKTFNDSFRRKAFIVFTIFTTFLIGSLCAFFITIQTRNYKEYLFGNGKLYAEVLAKNSRLGIFSGNKEMLENAVGLVMNQKDVVQSSIYDKSGRKIFQKIKTPQNKNIDDGKKFLKIRNNRSATYEAEEYIFFWETVVSKVTNPNMDFFNPTVTENTIGYVCVVKGKLFLKKQLSNIRTGGITIGVFFWALGLLLFYYTVRKFTDPLIQLTNGVKALDSGKEFEPIRIYYDDEVGKLAFAFNKLTETLNRREDALKKSKEKLRNLSTKLIYSQEEERKRLSFELHDELGQSLAILKHNARYIKNNLKEKDEYAVENCENMISYIDEIIENVRRLSRDLSPSILEDLGLRTTLKWMFENFASQHKISVTKKMSFNLNMDTFFSKDTQTNIYRLLQEILTNIIKHSKADVVQFSVLEFGDNLMLSVFDNGVGFDYNNMNLKFPESRGIGLTAIEERARMIGADLTIDSTRGKGTKIILSIPIYKGFM
ncbi:MAG: sensor histidine kinase [Desulfobacterales bacterium]|nr:sensor histidine kinase [Desulfobacterales bacterium]MCP4162923.1 sensor histidine kinase [Deltaproteobacteria bacterium]